MRVPSEEDLRRLYDRAPIGMYRSTSDGRFVFVNPGLVAMLGYDDADELLGLSLERDVYYDATARQPLVDRYLQKGVLDGLKVRWKTKSGAPITVQVFGYVVKDPNGGEWFDSTVIDVTALEQTQADLVAKRTQLERTATTLSLLLRQLPAAIWTVDRELHVTSLDGAVQLTEKYEARRLAGRTLHHVFPDDDSELGLIPQHKAALDGDVRTFDYDWKGRHFACTVGPQRDDAGVIVGAIGTAIDITQSRRLEQRMVDAQRAESLGVLAGGLAHDFNNLLVAILGNADLAVRELTSSGGHGAGRSAMDNVRSAALRAAELTNQLLAYAGRGGTATADVHVRPLVDELLRIAAPTLPKTLHAAVDIPEQLPPARGDATQFRQVVMNLIANARDAMGPRGGKLTITARQIHLESIDPRDALTPPAPGSYVMVAVEDDGPGMDDATQRRVFEPFFTTKQTGHGLGLASVLGIVRAHGGGIRLSSTPGVGTRFEILWPCRGRAKSVVTPAPQPQSQRVVWVIDDEEMVRDVLSRMLEDLGYAVIAHGDGAEALTRLEANGVSCDAVIVDMTMPGMSGAAVVSGVRLLRPSTPIIVCSGYDRDHHGPLAVEGYLAKPFRFEELEAVLRRLVTTPAP